MNNRAISCGWSSEQFQQQNDHLNKLSKLVTKIVHELIEYGISLILVIPEENTTT